MHRGEVVAKCESGRRTQEGRGIRERERGETMAAYIIVPPVCRGTHRQITGLHTNVLFRVRAHAHTHTTRRYLLETRRRMVTARHAHTHAKPRRFVLSPLKIRGAWAKRAGIRESKALKSPTRPPRSNREIAHCRAAESANRIIVLRLGVNKLYDKGYYKI